MVPLTGTEYLHSYTVEYLPLRTRQRKIKLRKIVFDICWLRIKVV